MVGYSYQGSLDMPTASEVEYVVSTRIGEKGQLTIPKQYRDDLGLGSGAPVAVLRIGEGLMLIPEQSRLQQLCESIAAVFEGRQITPESLLDSLPGTRERIYARRYSAAVAKKRGASRRRSKVG